MLQKKVLYFLKKKIASKKNKTKAMLCGEYEVNGVFKQFFVFTLPSNAIAKVVLFWFSKSPFSSFELSTFSLLYKIILMCYLFIYYTFWIEYKLFT